MLVKEIELKKWGNSQGLRIGKAELKELGEEGTDIKFQMVVEQGKITLTPIKKYPSTVEELFADYAGEPLGKEDNLPWGDSAGREIL